MSAFTIDITGDVNKKMDKITEDISAVLNDELSIFGIETVALAKNLAPTDIGFLKNGITFDKLPAPQIGVEIISAMNYSAYVEFGTGVFAAAYLPALPVAVQEYAATFFVNGKGRMPARPFLFPAVEANAIKLKETLNALLK